MLWFGFSLPPSCQVAEPTHLKVFMRLYFINQTVLLLIKKSTFTLLMMLLLLLFVVFWSLITHPLFPLLLFKFLLLLELLLLLLGSFITSGMVRSSSSRWSRSLRRHCQKCLHSHCQLSPSFTGYLLSESMYSVHNLFPQARPQEKSKLLGVGQKVEELAADTSA